VNFTQHHVDAQTEVRILREGWDGRTARIYAVGRDGSWAWAYTRHKSTLKLRPDEAEVV
jgi:hypothetical protein